MIDDLYRSNLAKIYVCAVFHSRKIQKNVSPKFVELCFVLET